jgi:hypothetical protein
MNKYSILLVLLLTGCAGISTYNVEPFYDDNVRAMVCCRATVTSGKNINGLTLHVNKQGENYTVDLQENGVNSSESIQAVAAPVTAVANAVSNTAEAVQKLSKDVP